MGFINRDLIVGVCLIMLLSAGAAFVVNGVSKKRIPLVGQWDVNAGVPMARPHPTADEREIKDIESAGAIFDRGDALFIDARPEDVYREGHVRGAIPFPVHEFEERIFTFIENYPDTGMALVLYCSGRTCMDSHVLAEDLSTMGYTNIRVMIDGFDGWKKKGYPIEGASH